MLKITIPSMEIYDPEENLFINTKEQTLSLEHSLVSISKWESKWRKPFLSKDSKTIEELKDYVRCMTLTQNVDPDLYKFIPESVIRTVLDYIDEPMTATWFRDDKSKPKSREVITSEIIYYWMIAQGIPFECQKWHLNRLLTLIRVCSEKNAPQKKMGKKELLSRNKALNAARRKAHKSKG